MQQRALIIGWMATIMAVDSASEDENLILAAACVCVWMVREHRCARLSFAWSVLCYNGFRESVLKGKLLPGRCFGAMRFDRHARHIRPLEKHSLSDFRLKCNAGAWMATMLHLVHNWNYFLFSRDRMHAAFGLLARQDPAGLPLSSFLAREHPLHFWREREYFPHLFEMMSCGKAF